MKFFIYPATFLIIFLLYSCSVADEPKEMEQEVKTEISKNDIEYYENGNKKTEGTLVNGKRQGKWLSYYPNGYKWSEVHFYKGVKQGPTQNYYENGMMRYQGSYSNDERSGIWLFYDEDGVLIKKVNADEPENIDSLKTNN